MRPAQPETPETKTRFQKSLYRSVAAKGANNYIEPYEETTGRSPGNRRRQGIRLASREILLFLRCITDRRSARFCCSAREH